MAYENQPADDQLNVSVSGSRAEVVYRHDVTGEDLLPHQQGQISVSVPIDDWENKSKNAAEAEAREKARPLFKALIRAFRGKDD